VLIRFNRKGIINICNGYYFNNGYYYKNRYYYNNHYYKRGVKRGPLIIGGGVGTKEV